MRGFFPRFVYLGIMARDSHLTSDFCECFQLFIYKGDIALAYKISPINRESLQGSRVRWRTERMPWTLPGPWGEPLRGG
jgi:hypothetical protein